MNRHTLSNRGLATQENYFHRLGRNQTKSHHRDTEARRRARPGNGASVSPAQRVVKTLLGKQETRRLPCREAQTKTTAKARRTRREREEDSNADGLLAVVFAAKRCVHCPMGLPCFGRTRLLGGMTLPGDWSHASSPKAVTCHRSPKRRVWRGRGWGRRIRGHGIRASCFGVCTG